MGEPSSRRRERWIRQFGPEGARIKEREKKARERARRRSKGLPLWSGLVTKRTRTSVEMDGVTHPFWCACYDCLYGAVADMKRRRRGLEPIPESPDEPRARGSFNG